MSNVIGDLATGSAASCAASSTASWVPAARSAGVLRSTRPTLIGPLPNCALATPAVFGGVLLLSDEQPTNSNGSARARARPASRAGYGVVNRLGLRAKHSPRASRAG